MKRKTVSEIRNIHFEGSITSIFDPRPLNIREHLAGRSQSSDLGALSVVMMQEFCHQPI